MLSIDPTLPLIGGALIGVAASVLLLIGRVAGISGIVGELFHARPTEDGWRMAFLAGLGAGGLLLATLAPTTLPSRPASPVVLIGAGLLVGLGTRMANGCTSGHGVCGIPKAAPRSLASTAVFMAVGAVTATLLLGS
jgi:uncharacterized membrane protein YedE/YeeE